MVQAGILNVLVTASTGQANAALRKTAVQFRSTAATAEKSSAATAASWRKVGLGLGLVAVAAGKLAIDFDQAMTQIETQAGAPRGEIEKLRGSVLELAKSSVFAPEQLANALFHVESVGFRGSKALHVLNAAQKAATVGNSDLESTTYALVSALETGIRGTQNLTKTIGTLDAIVGTGDMRMEDLTASLSTGILPAAKNVGLSLTDVGAALDLMTARGVPAQAAATRLRMTFALMSAPTDAAKDALKGIGLESTDLAKAMRGPEGLPGAVQLLADHLDTVSKTKANVVITKAFGGGRSSAAIQTLVQNVDDLNERYKQVTEQTGEFGRKLKTAQETPLNRLRAAWSTIQVTLIDVGTSLEGPVASSFSIFADIVDKTAHGLMALPPVVGDFTGKVLLLSVAFMTVSKVGGLFIGFLMTMVRTLAVVRAAYVITAESAGILAGAQAALGAAMAASPFGVAIAGAALLTGAYFGLKAILGDTSDEMHGVSKMQWRLRQTSENLSDSLKEQHQALDALKSSSKNVRQAHKDERDATAAVHRAEDRLAKVRANYPQNAKPVLDAERDLLQAKRREERVTHRVERAEKAQGQARDAAKTSLQAAARSERDRIDTLQQLRKHLQHVLGGQKAFLLSDDQVIKKTNRLDNVEKELDKARKDRQNTLKLASDTINPKYSRSLDKQTDSVVKVTRENAKMGRTLQRQAIPFLQDATKQTNQLGDAGDQTATIIKQQFMLSIAKAIGGTDKFRGSTHKAGDELGSFRRTGVGAMGAVGDKFGSLSNMLGISNKGFGFHDPNRKKKRTGGFMVNGAGNGDKVPVNLLLEPGETGFILNKHATREIAALKAANEAFPRSKMQGGGIVPVPGFPGESANAKIIPSMEQYIKRFHLFLTDAYGSAHASLEHTKYGTAGDFIPGPGGSWPLVASAARYAVQRGWTPVGWDGSGGTEAWPGHGPPSRAGANAHEHVTFLTAAELLAGQMPGAMAAAFIKKIMITGPSGGLKTVAQAAEEVLRKAANKRLAAYGPASEAGDFAGSAAAKGISSPAEFIPFWNRLNPSVKWAGPAFAKIIPRESGWNARASNGSHFGWYQFDAPTWSDFGSGPVSNAFNPVAATIAAGNVAEREGRAGIMSRWAQTFSGFRHGGLARAEQMMDHLKKQRRGIGRLDENIDIAQRTAELMSSPAGSDLSPSEIAKQVDLQSKLLKELRNEYKTARLGSRFTDRLFNSAKRGKDGRTEELKRKLDNLKARRRNILQAEHNKKNPSLNATNSVDREIEQKQRALDKHREKLRKDMDKIRTLRSAFHDAKSEMAGVTGKGGRIFDTKLALDELRHTAAGGPGGLSISQLIDFAHALQYGAFQHGLPTFHSGGIAKPFRAGQTEMGAILKRDEGVFTPEQMDALRMGGSREPSVNIYLPDGMEWMRDRIRVEINEHERKATAIRKAGVAR